MSKVSVCLVCMFVAAPTGAVQRCDMPDGKVLFTDSSCPDGAKIKPVSVVVRPSEVEARSAEAQSMLIRQKGDEASARVAKQLAADEERSRQRRQMEREATAREEMLETQRRQAAALERIARESSNRPIVRDCYLSDPRCKR